jgi:hypothetical protein
MCWLSRNELVVPIARETIVALFFGDVTITDRWVSLEFSCQNMYKAKISEYQRLRM